MARVRKSNKRSRHSRRVRRGGAFVGAPLNYSLAGSEASRSSLSQGGDYLQYHQGQHGGMAPFDGASSVLESSLRGPAHLAGLDKAFAEIQGMQDGGRRRTKRRGSKRCGSKRSGSKRSGSKRCGSKRSGSKRSGSKRRGSKRSGSKRSGSKRSGSKRRGSKRSKRQGGNRSRRQRRRGGSLGYSPFPGQGMLLSGAQYAQAGLNPEWKGNAEFEAAAARGAL